MFVSHEVIDPNIEKRIVTSLIVSDRIANELIPLTHRDLFRLDASRIIYSWVAEFQKSFGAAPKANMQDIFDSNKINLRTEDLQIVSEFLSTLSSDFENSEYKNEEYLLDQARKYLRKRHLITMAEDIKKYADADLLDDADKCINKYGSIIDSGLSGWQKPFDDEDFVSTSFNKKEEEALFQFPGALGSLIGPLRRAWFMMVLGPMKRGKTRTLMDVTFHAMSMNKRVAFFSLEMEDTDMSMLLYQKILSMPEEEGDILYPKFDCVLNQKNSCNVSGRLNNIKKPQTYTPYTGYKPCDICRTADPYGYHPATWFELVHRKAANKKDALSAIRTFKMQYGYHNLRLRSYPVGTANIQTIDSHLKAIEMSTGWIPDVIVIDYADILMPEEKGLTGRDKENAAWLACKCLAQTRKALVVTGSQGNRASFDVESLSEGNTSEDIRKLAHIDLAITLNQTDEEKEEGIMRIGVLNHRWKKFNKLQQALVLQCMEVGQFNLDSTIIDTRRYKYEKV